MRPAYPTDPAPTAARRRPRGGSSPAPTARHPSKPPLGSRAGGGAAERAATCGPRVLAGGKAGNRRGLRTRHAQGGDRTRCGDLPHASDQSSFIRATSMAASITAGVDRNCESHHVVDGTGVASPQALQAPLSCHPSAALRKGLVKPGPAQKPRQNGLIAAWTTGRSAAPALPVAGTYPGAPRLASYDSPASPRPRDERRVRPGTPAQDRTRSRWASGLAALAGCFAAMIRSPRFRGRERTASSRRQIPSGPRPQHPSEERTMPFVNIRIYEGWDMTSSTRSPGA